MTNGVWVVRVKSWEPHLIKITIYVFSVYLCINIKKYDNTRIQIILHTCYKGFKCNCVCILDSNTLLEQEACKSLLQKRWNQYTLTIFKIMH